MDGLKRWITCALAALWLMAGVALAESAPDVIPEPTGAPAFEFIDPGEVPAADAPEETLPAADAPEETAPAVDVPEEMLPAADAPEEMVPSVVMQIEREKIQLPLSGVRIGIDPGHQARGNAQKEAVAPNSSQTKAKVSSGTSGVATGVAEYVTVLEISLKLRDALESQGAEVYMTRETHDVDLSNQQRAQMMNALEVDLVLRIHCDGAENRSKHGIALYCSRSNSIAGESYRAAECILPRVCEATGASNNGIVSNDNYTGQNWSTVPCIMVECGFMSNPDEDRLLNDEDYQWKLAAGLTDGIIDYIVQRDGGQ